VETIQFEAVKLSLRQDSKGFALHLSIHPDEIPDELVRHFVGARYQVVMVRLDHDEKPAGPNYVSAAGRLCKYAQFQEFLFENNLTFEKTVTAAEQAVRDICNIQSRRELMSNESAQKTFKDLVNQYEEWKHGSARGSESIS